MPLGGGEQVLLLASGAPKSFVKNTELQGLACDCLASGQVCFAMDPGNRLNITAYNPRQRASGKRGHIWILCVNFAAHGAHFICLCCTREPSYQSQPQLAAWLQGFGGPW
eukprot:scaffold222824_cov31-Tisochrysis_lutea.AAC.1